jgi:predicted metal-dependent phosphotriesterase family hydrolase
MLQTVTGSIGAELAGSMLAHEHVLVGFVEDGKLTPDLYDRDEVVTAIAPLLLLLKEAGCSTMVDCAPEYLGRDPYILRQLSELTGVHLVTNTGFYKKPYLPAFVYELPERELAELWKREAEQGIGESGVYPGFIKIALNDGTAIDEIQLKILRAAMRASLDTGLPIQCHTIGSGVAMHAHDVMKQAQFDQERFIWVHAQTFQDDDVYLRLAAEGGWISIDSISMKHYREQVELLLRMHRLGIGDRVLLSQDTGWYNVGQPGGGAIHPYHLLFTDFIPAAAADGLDAAWLQQCVTSHAFQAMSRRSR